MKLHKIYKVLNEHSIMRRTAFLVFLIVLLIGCAQQAPPPDELVEEQKPVQPTPEPQPESKKPTEAGVSATIITEPIVPETVSFKAKDDVTIFASYYPGNEEVIILLHMLGSDRHAWDDFAKELNDLGYTVIAPDLRGHGASDKNYKKFSYADFNNMVFDIEAAKEFVGKGSNRRLTLIGASIGANIAVEYGITDPDVDKVALLSPGLEYRGVNIEFDIVDLDRPTFFVYSAGDTYSAESSETLYAKVEGKHHRTRLKKYAGNEHGTRMFAGTNLNVELIDWLATP